MSLQTRLTDLLWEIFSSKEQPRDALNIIYDSMSELEIQYGVYCDSGYLFVEDDVDPELIHTTTRSEQVVNLISVDGALEKEFSKRDSLRRLFESIPTPSPPTGQEEQADLSLLEEDRESVADYIRHESQLVEEKALVDFDVVKDACEHFSNPIPTTAPMELTSISNQNQMEINNIMKAAISTYNIQSSHVFYFEVRRAVISLNYHINFSRLLPEKKRLFMASGVKQTKHTELQRVGKRMSTLFSMFGSSCFALLSVYNCPKLARITNDLWESILCHLKQCQRFDRFSFLDSIAFDHTWTDFLNKVAFLVADNSSNKKRKLIL